MGMTERAVAIRLLSRPVMGYVRWAERAGAAAVVLALAALFVQPPVQAAAGIPSKADPALYAQATADASRTFPVIVRETQPGSTATEDLIRTLGGHVTHELSIIGGFSATVPGSAVSTLTASPLVWRARGGPSPPAARRDTSQYKPHAAQPAWQEPVRLSQGSSPHPGP